MSKPKQGWALCGLTKLCVNPPKPRGASGGDSARQRGGSAAATRARPGYATRAHAVTAFDYLRDNINHALPKYPLIGIRGRGFDPHSLSGHEIAVCVLLASDGAQNHCVTIMHNMIFDACEVHALPLTQESLDICVRAHSEDCERCVAVAQALLLSPSKKIVAALRRKPHDWRC